MPWSDREIELSMITDVIAGWQHLWSLAATMQDGFPSELKSAVESTTRDVESSLARFVPVMATFHPDVVTTIAQRLAGMADFVADLPDGRETTRQLAAGGRRSPEVRRLVVIDQSREVARGLELLLRYVSSEQVQLATSSADPDDTVPLILREQPDVALVRLHDLEDARRTVTEVAGRFPAVRVVVLLDPEDMTEAWELVDLGAAAVVPSSTSAAGLIGPVLACASDLTVVSTDVAVQAAARMGRRDRVLRELDADAVELWRRLARGHSDKRLARDLQVSDRTAKRRVATLLRRIGASNRIEAAGLAGRYGLLD